MQLRAGLPGVQAADEQPQPAGAALLQTLHEGGHLLQILQIYCKFIANITVRQPLK